MRNPNFTVENWQYLRKELDALSLEEQATASELFADFVLGYSPITAPFLEKLAQYFQWGRDYRDAARIDVYKLTQLRELLIADMPPKIRSPNLIEQATKLLRLDWVLEHQGKFYGCVCGALARPIRGMMAETYETKRNVFGVSFNRWRATKAALFLATAARLLVVLVLVVPLTYLFMKPDQDPFGWMIASVFFGGVYWIDLAPEKRTP